ncbi:C25 family cysteine peptidase [Fulvivirga sedimenti]|uniref:C25 family cysteine peptidase n=1 Tax=Fulvivirga sedimenti TaxID=2879465 RepID=A0A9X1HN73_9BACT|nr:C25 family cysteine peptidase [Fulvivirga sedimenti]MCA6073677.1 C25 family cysteine peptidase [Fulvivirga sedimenti]
MRCIGIIAFILTGISVFAQPYGDEWIDYNKQYWRIQTAEEGIYRISYTDLELAGFPVTSLDPRRIQLYHRGTQVAIYVEGQADAVFNPTDFIEFYGTKNDGTLDANLYSPSTFQPHKLYNIFSDSTAYFLTYTLSPLEQGKRMRAYKENNTSNLPAENYARDELSRIITDDYAPGRRFNSRDVTRLTAFDQGEGWTGRVIQEGQNVLYSVSGIQDPRPDLVPSLEVLITGRDNETHVVEISAGPTAASQRNLGSVTFADYESRMITAPLLVSDFSASGDLVITVFCRGVSGEDDLVSLSYARVSYARAPDMRNAGQRKFRFTATSGTKAYVEIANVPDGSEMFDVTDPANVEIVRFNRTASGINAIVQNASAERTLLLTSNFRPVFVRPAKMRRLDPQSANYIIITNSFLRSPALGYEDPVKSYGTYRASEAGGGYDTMIVNVRELFDQFSYGETTPLAVYNFMKKLVAEGRPEYLFLAGKGLEPQQNFYRNPNGFFQVTKDDNGRTYQIRDLVPTAGTPGADVAFTAGLAGTTYEAAVATGRLPANTSLDVAAYLEKVIAMESQPFDDLFRKRLLHLSGGISATELLVFRSFMDGFAAVAEDIYLGGDVQTIQKDRLDLEFEININEEINSGLGFVTFFGHSAPSVTDIDIGFVTDPNFGYNNPDKYPMFLVNGCQAGQFFASDIVFGEDWITSRNLGAIGFIAHSSFGFQYALRRYSDIFYQTAFGDSLYFNKPIGNVQQEVARRYMNITAESPLTITQVQQMVLLGDPAASIFGAQKPDYETNSNQLFIEASDGAPVTSRTPELIMNIITRNFGKTYNDSIAVRVTRTLPDNSVLSYDSVFAPVYFQDTLRVLIPNGFASAGGNNLFSVVIDYPDELDELNENNNTGILQLFIPTFATRNVFPVDFSINSSTDVRLIAQSTDPLSEERLYAFELDTARTFNSPIKRTAVISGKLLATWDPGILPTGNADSVTFFWRSRYNDPAPDESDDWDVSSFSYINNGPEGWTQRVYHQFDEDIIEGLSRDDSRQKLDFISSTSAYNVLTAGAGNPLTNEQVSVTIDGIEYMVQNQFCRDNTLNFIAFNRNTAFAYLGLPLPVTDSRTCGRQPLVINSFSGAQINLATGGVVDYINGIDDGNIVSFFNIGQVNYSLFSAGVQAALADIGLTATEISSWTNGEAVIVIGRKGAAPGTAEVYRATTAPVIDQELFHEAVITGILDKAVIQTAQIGPASSWGDLSFFNKLKGEDKIQIDLIGVSLGGQETQLLADLDMSPVDLTSVDAANYPYLKLRADLEDLQDRTTPELVRWQVSYEGVPEGLLIARDVRKPQVEVQEGAVIENVFGFVNISERTFSDSLTVRYSIFNRTQQQGFEEFTRIKAPLPGDTTFFNIVTQTAGQTGLLDYSVRVNPQIEPEQYYDNNQFDERGYILVGQDNINPLIDVVFDGEYIMDGDIVSPNPLISVKLLDENEFLLKTDTTNISLALKQPCEGCTYQNVTFSSSAVTWSPATAEKPFSIEYRPGILEDGLYGFRVQAADASGNFAGDEAYEINFEVINESTITNFYPYPNPFSTNTRFVFTLTGATIPEGIKIQIMTVTGKVVREITQDELGPIRIGHNLTEYAWDGRDEFGDQLANGVYLYRVLIQSGAGDLEHRETAGDKAFKKGFGKIYILR